MMWTLVLVPVGIVVVGALVADRLRVLGAVQVGGQPLFGFGAMLAPWVLLASAGLAVAYLADRIYRLWRFDRCEGPMCRWCSGPLGPERQGRYEVIRRCMLCRRYTGSAHYSR